MRRNSFSMILHHLKRQQLRAVYNCRRAEHCAFFLFPSSHGAHQTESTYNWNRSMCLLASVYVPDSIPDTVCYFFQWLAFNSMGFNWFNPFGKFRYKILCRSCNSHSRVYKHWCKLHMLPISTLGFSVGFLLFLVCFCLWLCFCVGTDCNFASYTNLTANNIFWLHLESHTLDDYFYHSRTDLLYGADVNSKRNASKGKTEKYYLSLIRLKCSTYTTFCAFTFGLTSFN